MARMPIFAVMAAGLVIAGLPPAVAVAAPCSQWGFNGSTTFDFDGGGKLRDVSGGIDGNAVDTAFLGDGDL